MGKRKTQRGRPANPPGKGKTVLMQVRLSPAEKTVFAEVAELSGEQLSVWVRQRLRQAAREEMKVRGRPDPFSAGQEDERRS